MKLGRDNMSMHPYLINQVQLRQLHVDEPLENEPFDSDHGNFVPNVNQNGQYWEDPDLNDVVLKYINQILMEDDKEDCTIEQSFAFQATEKSFYQALDPTSPINGQTTSFSGRNFLNTDQNFIQHYCNSNNSGSCDTNNLSDPRWESNFCTDKPYCVQTSPIPLTPQSSSQVLLCLTGGKEIIEVDYANTNKNSLKFPCTCRETEGVDARHNCDLFANSMSTSLLPMDQSAQGHSVARSVYTYENVSSGRENPPCPDVNLDCVRTSSQQAARSVMSEAHIFDLILLSSGEQCESALRQAFQSIGLSERSRGKKGRDKTTKDSYRNVDLRALLNSCAESIAADNRRSAEELLYQIRQQSSPTGDGMQRLASYFANALEARLSGNGTESYIPIFNQPSSTAALGLKCQHLFASICPYMKLSYYFSNKTIMQFAKKATKLHIVDFGINYGFQWPSFIEQLSSRPGGPPLLRITAIDSPKPGLRPTEWIEETGCRLANYAGRFKVPFKFNIITKRWETIEVEDIGVEMDEVLVVNCMYQLRLLSDESVAEGRPSPRDAVCQLIKSMDPKVFIHGVWSAAFTTPYFLTRFREAMHNYSSMFDLLDSTLPREIPDRRLFEQMVLGCGSMNVISCEGITRNERSETYRQWQSRNQRAGFRQLPLSEEVVRTAKKWVASVYHKDFLVEQDAGWLLQGWKGRILNAISSWKPVHGL